MTDWLLLLLPVLAVPIVLLYRFLGCGTLIGGTADPPTLSITLKPTEAELNREANDHEIATVSVQSLGGFSENVALSIEPMKGVTAKFEPAFVKPDAYKTVDAKLRLTVGKDADPGSRDLKVIGTSAAAPPHTDDATVKLTVNDFEISLSPPALTLGRGEATPVTVTIKSLGNFSADTALTTAGLAGLAASLAPSTVKPPVNGSVPSILTVQAVNIAAGMHTLTITAGTVAGAPNTLTHDAPLALTVIEPDFSLSATPPAVTAQRGQPMPPVTLTITRVGGFAGAVDPDAPGFAGVFTFTPDPAPGTSSQITATIPPGQPIGPVNVTVIGVSGSLTRAANFTVNVTA